MPKSLLITLSIVLWNPFIFAVPTYNQLLLEVIREMPKGGGYDTSNSTLKKLESSIEIEKDPLKGGLTLRFEKAAPSFCSAATYLAFIQLLNRLQQNKAFQLTSETQKELLIYGQPDGSGVWGRWNANGPGTARLFYELGLGRNFTMDKLNEAQPGDFLKIFWNDEIGVHEHGHSVIFTGLREKEKARELCFWSSNKASEENPVAGMGEKCVDLKKIRRGIFSRLENPERLVEAPKKIGTASASYKDIYLESMLKVKSSMQEVCSKVGCN